MLDVVVVVVGNGTHIASRKYISEFRNFWALDKFQSLEFRKRELIRVVVAIIHTASVVCAMIRDASCEFIVLSRKHVAQCCV